MVVSCGLMELRLTSIEIDRYPIETTSFHLCSCVWSHIRRRFRFISQLTPFFPQILLSISVCLCPVAVNNKKEWYTWRVGLIQWFGLLSSLIFFFEQSTLWSSLQCLSSRQSNWFEGICLCSSFHDQSHLYLLFIFSVSYVLITFPFRICPVLCVHSSLQFRNFDCWFHSILPKSIQL